MNVDSVSVNNYPFNKVDIALINNDPLVSNSFPVVYILYDPKNMIAYVGESTNVINRMNNHLTHPEKKNLKLVYIISDSSFNKSATLDIESNLIQYLDASGKFKLLNANTGISNHNYYQKDEYFKMFKNIWSKLSFNDIKMKDLLELKNSDFYKFSPYKALSNDQFRSILEILKNYSINSVKSIFINGSSGTGKTILAVYFIKLISTLYNYDLEDLEIEDELLLVELDRFKKKFQKKIKIGLVVPMTSLRSTLKKVFKSTHGLNSNMVIGPTDVIKKEYDFLIIDEAHRLTRRKSIMGYGAFDKVNKKLNLYKTEIKSGKSFQDVTKNGNQLDWMMKCSKFQLFFYDSEQSIRPADVRKEDFDKIKSDINSREITLVSQLRSKGNNDYINFIDDLLYSKIKEGSKKYFNQNYELILFDDMSKMIKSLKKCEQKYELSRLMSGYSWPWVSKTEPEKPDAIIDGMELFWNRKSSDWINSTTDTNEMGCIHTVQGYDLNYAGIIFGKEIGYDKKNKKIMIDKDHYHDALGKQGLTNSSELKEYVINIYKTMMFRAIRGTFVYACDKNLREYFKKHIEINKRY